MSEDEIETVSEAFENVESASDHRRRADDLVEEAERCVETLVLERLQFDGDVDCTYEKKSGIFKTTIEPTTLLEELHEELDTGQSVILGDPLTLKIGETLIEDDVKNLKTVIGKIEDDYDEGAPVEKVIQKAALLGMDPDKAEHEIQKLKQQGEVYVPSHDHLRTT